MQIVSDDLRFRLVEARQIRDGAGEGVVRRLRRQIADVLTNEHIPLYAERDRVLEMRSDGENSPLRLTQRDRKWSVAPGTAQHHSSSGNDSKDRIVNVPNDWAIVDEKKIGNVTETFQGLVFIDANRLVAQISACGHNGKIQLAQEQMVQRRIGEHDAKIGICWSNCQRKAARRSLQKDDWRLGRSEKRFFGL